MSILEQYRKISQKQNEVVVEEIVREENTKEHEMSIQDALKMFGYDEFKKGQEEVIKEVIYGKDGVLAVFPTGFGKSLVYQIPPLVTGKLTVVVSPLISLMRDQVAKLQGLGINAIFINSTVPMSDVKMAMLEVQSGGVKALYVAPERFDNAEFMRILKGVKVDVLAIDEAHCISRYGQDFRPSYARLGGVIEELSPRQVVALTATATEAVQTDICRILGIEKSKKFLQGVYRENLSFSVIEGLGPYKFEKMAQIVKKFVSVGMTTGIVYSPTRKEAEAICGYFNDSGVRCVFYHAGLKDAERAETQDEWGKNGGVIVATCAFGMGIDRPDVRFVIHSGLSQSVEDIVQECGRAGRDGKESFCISFWDKNEDYRTQMFLIDLTNPCMSDVNKFWKWMKNAAIEVSVENATSAELNLTQKVMGTESKCINVGGCIAVLKSKGIVETLGRGKYKVMLDGDIGNIAVLDDVRKDKIEKLNNVMRFYGGTGCRVDFICKYFGDNTFNGRCGSCDNCTKKGK